MNEKENQKYPEVQENKAAHSYRNVLTGFTDAAANTLYPIARAEMTNITSTEIRKEDIVADW